jgi:hypothetical protein
VAVPFPYPHHSLAFSIFFFSFFPIHLLPEIGSLGKFTRKREQKKDVHRVHLVSFCGFVTVFFVPARCSSMMGFGLDAS